MELPALPPPALARVGVRLFVIRALSASVIGAILVACLVAPLVHLGLRGLEGAPDWPYSRVFDRTAMVALTVLLFAFHRRIDMRRLLEAWRRGTARQRVTALAAGFVLSCASGLAIVLLLVATGALTSAGQGVGQVALLLLGALPAAVAVALIEEGFFRVLVFEGLERRLGVWAAAGVSSAFYAAIHFLAPARHFQVDSWTPTVGFEYLGAILSRYALPSVHAGMLGLFITGLVLCAALRKTRLVHLCIGLHAGWFLAAKAAVRAANVAPEVALPSGVNARYFMVGQPLTWLVLAACGVVIWWGSAPLSAGGPSEPSPLPEEA